VGGWGCACRVRCQLAGLPSRLAARTYTGCSSSAARLTPDGAEAARSEVAALRPTLHLNSNEASLQIGRTNWHQVSTAKRDSRFCPGLRPLQASGGRSSLSRSLVAKSRTLWPRGELLAPAASSASQPAGERHCRHECFSWATLRGSRAKTNIRPPNAIHCAPISTLFSALLAHLAGVSVAPALQAVVVVVVDVVAVVALGGQFATNLSVLLHSLARSLRQTGAQGKLTIIWREPGANLAPTGRPSLRIHWRGSPRARRPRLACRARFGAAPPRPPGAALGELDERARFSLTARGWPNRGARARSSLKLGSASWWRQISDRPTMSAIIWTLARPLQFVCALARRQASKLWRRLVLPAALVCRLARSSGGAGQSANANKRPLAPERRRQLRPSERKSPPPFWVSASQPASAPTNQPASPSAITAPSGGPVKFCQINGSARRPEGAGSTSSSRRNPPPPWAPQPPERWRPQTQ